MGHEQVCRGLAREGRPVDEHYRKSVPLAAKPFKNDGLLRRISMIAQFESKFMRKESRRHEPTAKIRQGMAAYSITSSARARKKQKPATAPGDSLCRRFHAPR